VQNTFAPQTAVDGRESVMIKQWARRNRRVAEFFERAKDRRRDTEFSRHLDATVGQAVRWQRSEEAIACASAEVAALQAIVEPPARKGSPSKVGIRAPQLQLIAETLRANAAIGSRELAATERIASIDPADPRAFRLYLAIAWLANVQLLQAMRTTSRDRIVVHMTCAPRLARAALSIASFPANAGGALHLKLVGNGSQHMFDASDALLSVAAPDSYECLPQKVFQGLSLLTLACNPSAIVKLDDDHRLKESSELDRLLAFAASSSEAMQLGDINRTPSPSAHHRGWHFEKCARAELNDRILEMPAPVKWAAGSAGYVLNRPALWRILWASLYYRQWLEQILYEDIALAEVATKTGIRLVHVEMSRAIGAVSEY
jgi:hypothetical protein